MDEETKDRPADKPGSDLADSGLLALLTAAGAFALAAAGVFFGVRRQRRQSPKRFWQRLRR